MDSGLAFWVLAVLAAFAIGMSKGGLAGTASLAVPLLSLVISPVVAAGLLLPIYIVSDVFAVWAYRKHYSLRILKIVIPAAAIGIAVGWALSASISEPVVRLLVGLLGLSFCLELFFKRKQEVAPRSADLPRGVFWGAIAGFTSFVSHAGATPYQVWVLPQQLSKMTYAGTTAIAFAAINWMKLPPYIALGQVTLNHVPTMLALMLVAIIGALAGLRLTKVIPQQRYFGLVMGLLFLLSVKLTYDGILALI